MPGRLRLKSACPWAASETGTREASQMELVEHKPLFEDAI